MWEQHYGWCTYPHPIRDVGNALMLTLVRLSERGGGIVAHRSHEDQGEVADIA